MNENKNLLRVKVIHTDGTVGRITRLDGDCVVIAFRENGKDETVTVDAHRIIASGWHY
jgi:hypothetical protein